MKGSSKVLLLMEEINSGYTWQRYQNSRDLRPKSRLAWENPLNKSVLKATQILVKDINSLKKCLGGTELML